MMDEPTTGAGLDEEAFLIPTDAEPTNEAEPANEGEAASEAEAKPDSLLRMRAQIAERHEAKLKGLQQTYDAARERHAEWAGTVGQPHFSAWLATVESRISVILQELETCKTADLQRMQGEIAAHRSTLAQIKSNASDAEAERARNAIRVAEEQRDLELSNWDRENALFVSQPPKRGKKRIATEVAA